MNLFIRKAIMLVIVLMGIALINYPVLAATDVGGIIDEDTTWDSAGSPYNITSTVQIDEGFTLTIDPDVVVNGHHSYDFQVWGTLSAIGTDLLNITLNNVTISAGAQHTGTLIFQFAEVYSGSISRFGIGSPAALTLLDS